MNNKLSPASKANREAMLGVLVVITVLAIIGGLAAWFLLPKSQSTSSLISNPAEELGAAYNTFYIKGDYAGGLEQYRVLSERYPANAKVWREYGQAAYFLDPISRAVTILQKATQLDATDPFPHFLLALLYLNERKKTEVEQTVQTIVKLSPDSWLGHAALAVLYLDKVELDKVMPEFEAMQKKAGNAVADPFYNLMLSSFYYSQDNIPKALETIEKTITSWPKMAAPLLAKSNYILYILQDREANQAKAFDIMLQAQKLHPDLSRVSLALATYYTYYSPDTISAEKYIQAALKAEPSLSQNINMLMGRIMWMKKDYNSAYKYFDECLKLEPKAYECIAESAWATMAQMKEARDKNPRSKETVNFLEAAYKKAQPLASIADGLPANYSYLKARYYYLLGSIEFYKEDFLEAINWYQKAADVQPKVPTFQVWIAWAYVAMEDYDSAQITYDKARAIDPNDTEVKDLEKYLEELDD